MVVMAINNVHNDISSARSTQRKSFDVCERNASFHVSVLEVVELSCRKHAISCLTEPIGVDFFNPVGANNLFTVIKLQKDSKVLSRRNDVLF